MKDNPTINTIINVNKPFCRQFLGDSNTFILRGRLPKILSREPEIPPPHLHLFALGHLTGERFAERGHPSTVTKTQHSKTPCLGKVCETLPLSSSVTDRETAYVDSRYELNASGSHPGRDHELTDISIASSAQGQWTKPPYSMPKEPACGPRHTASRFLRQN